MPHAGILGFTIVALVAVGASLYFLLDSLNNHQEYEKNYNMPASTNTSTFEVGYDTNRRKRKKEKGDCCVICLDPLSEFKIQLELTCGHTYHKKCINKYREESTGNKLMCPICRREVS